MTQSSRPQADNIANYPAPSDPGPYSADQWAEYMQIVYTTDQQATQGPVVRYLNELAVTDNGSTAVYVATGAGMVNGHLLVSSEQETFTIPAGPVASRWDVVVMVENNSNAEITQTVAGRPLLFPNDLSEYTATPGVPAYSARLAIIRGVDGGGVPALDQTTALYMVELARYQINNVPTISAQADNRVFCYFGSTVGTRTLWAPALVGRNTTDGTDLILTAPGYDGYLPLVDNKVCSGYGHAMIPTDYRGNMIVTAVVMPLGSSGNLWGRGEVDYGACTESWTLHTDNSGVVAVHAVTNIVHNCIAPVTLTNATIGDILHLRIYRDATSVNDTINNDVAVYGWYITYEAQS